MTLNIIFFDRYKIFFPILGYVYPGQLGLKYLFKNLKIFQAYFNLHVQISEVHHNQEQF